MADATPPVRLTFDDGVAHFTLDRPEALNTIDLDMARGLLVAAHEVAARADVRAVLIDGAGRSFCGGGNLRSFVAQPDVPSHLREVTSSLHAALSVLARLDAPTVVAVHGAAAGAGLGLACSGDIVLAADTARFVFAYTAIGLPGDGGSTWWLPRLVGVRRATEMALEGRQLSAAEALADGLVTRVVPADDLATEALATARRLATGATSAMVAAKRLLLDGLSASFESHMAREADAIIRHAATDDAREGLDAFLSKRSPNFKG